MEIPNKGHGQLSPELDTAHWNVVVFPATFQTGYIHLLLKPPYPRIIIWAPISVSSEGSSMLPCTDLQYPFCPCSPCNLQLQLASPQLLFSLLHLSCRLWHVCTPSAEQCHQMFVMPCQQQDVFLIPVWYLFTFWFFHDSRNSFPVIHDSNSEVAPELT